MNLSEEQFAQLLQGVQRPPASSSGHDARQLDKPKKFVLTDHETDRHSWPEWKFTFTNWMTCIEGEFADELASAEAQPAADLDDMMSMAASTQRRAHTLYAILANLMTGKLVRLLQALVERNGFLGWKKICAEMEPSTRTRSLALLQGLLAWPAWRDALDYTDQLYEYERAVREYEKASQKDLDGELKTAIVLRLSPMEIRTHLQLRVSEQTTYEQVRLMIVDYSTARRAWTAGGPPGLQDDAMHVDQLWKKGAGRGAGKGGDLCKHCGKPGHSPQECWFKDTKKSPDKGKGAGRGAGGKAAGGKTAGKKFTGECNHCGKTGHKEAECFSKANGKPAIRKVKQVESSASSSFEPGGEPVVVQQLSTIVEEYDASWIMAVSHENDDGDDELILLDSGSDEHTCQPGFAPLAPARKTLGPKMFDVQGKEITTSGTKQVRLRLEDQNGETLNAIADFVISEVKGPVLSLIKLKKRGAQFDLSDDKGHGIMTVQGKKFPLVIKRIFL
jgi:hypothetical protein